MEQASRKIGEGRTADLHDSDGLLAPVAVRTAFVDACMQRTWPGNVRELLVEVRAAVHMALAQSSKWLDEGHLAPQAGMGFPDEPQLTSGVRDMPGRDELEAILAEHRGNISAAARTLGVHRTQLRRWLTRHGLDAAQYAPGPSRSGK